MITTALNQVDTMVPLIESIQGADFQILDVSAQLLYNLSRTLDQITPLSKELKDKDYRSIVDGSLLVPRSELRGNTMLIDNQEQKDQAKHTLDKIREILLTPQRKRETRAAIKASEVGSTAPSDLIDLITEFTPQLIYRPC